MSKVPSLNYPVVLAAFQRGGWVVVRQRGSHIRLHRQTNEGVRKLTIPAHKPIKRSTLAKIISQADMTVDEFLALL
ncbi:MAG TPA: type II toxin-antitoxin system HicA family toxin [Thermoanaerobaculia bacterium]|nr:type II toxin-antitoxin system HicA family toxin [Thermoanaerobaculia bacterium]